MMRKEILAAIDRDSFRQNLRRFTWQAFNLIPPIERPLILDLGCGTGIPTIELAVLSKGRIDAVDKDARALSVLRDKASGLRLGKRIRTRQASIERPGVKKRAYDIVWSEGAIGAIGFAKGIIAWSQFLKPGGFMVIHDEKGDIDEKLKDIRGCGFATVNHFIITPDIWMGEYFRPLEQRFIELAHAYRGNDEACRIIAKEREEIDQFKSDPNRFATVFFVMKKI